MSQTYNPILGVEDLRRFRLTAPLRGPVIGEALVLERTVGEPIVVWHGTAVPEARTGNYRRAHRVDVANRGLALTTTAPSANPAFPFSVTIGMSCRVTDPVRIVWDGIYDMTGALTPSFVAVARAAAARFDALDPFGAEEEIRNRLTSSYPTAAVELSGFRVSVETVDAEQILTVIRKGRVDEIKRAGMLPVASGDRAVQLAQYMAVNDGDPSGFLEAEAKERAAIADRGVAIFEAVVGVDGIPKEDLVDLAGQAMSPYFPQAIESRGGGRIRDRIGRRSGELGAGDVVIGGVSDAGDEQPRRSSRVRGKMRRDHGQDR
jgi:hypothetical protein